MPLDNVVPHGPRTVWRVEMLGGLRAVPLVPGEDSGEPESVEQFRTHKTALLLARLALFPNRTHGREELADCLWPDAPGDRGRANVTQTLVYLRQALREPRTGGLLVSNHKTVRIARGLLQTDVAEWEAAAACALEAASGKEEQVGLLRSVLAAYRGILLPGLYEDWVCDERSRLDALRCAILQRLESLQSLPKGTIGKSVPEASRPELPAIPTIRNAPLVMTRFFGRDIEGAHAGRVLAQDPPVRLLTLLGTGGIGKTRFALHLAASAIRADTPDKKSAVFSGAVFVPLSEARTAAHMENILRDVLGIPNGGPAGLDAVTDHLRAQVSRLPDRLLLILDNLEQLEADAAPVVAHLLAGVPALTILATSRQPVGIVGEQEMPLGPLPGVPRKPDETVGDAVRLFVDRACLVRPDFTRTPENVPAIAHLCALLEGVPLALELAAAWVRVLTPEQISDRLHNRFGLLSIPHASSSGRSVPKRHQSLHAAIAWSYDLLGLSLQTFFAQLSVFRGGWTAAAARYVTEIKEVEEPLLLLAERSLILAEVDMDTGEMRYRMLESLREFAHEQALASLGGDTYTTLCVRKSRYFEDLTRQANEMVETGRGIRPARRLLDAERENLRALFAWLWEQMAEPAPVWESDTNLVSGVQAVIHSMVQSQWLWPVNEMRQHLCLAADAVRLLPTMLRIPLRAGVLSQQGLYALYAGDYNAAKLYLCEALDLWEAAGNRQQFFAVQKRLASLASHAGDQAGAIALWMGCLQFARETGDPYLEAGILNNMANEGQDLPQRRAWIEQAVLLDRRHSPGSHFLACSLNSMGGIAFAQGDWDVAKACLEEALDVAVADGADGMIGVTKMSLAELFSEMGEPPERARGLLQEAQRLFVERQEPLRVAQVHHLCFRIALRSGDADQAVADARAYLCVNRDAALMDAQALASAQGAIANELRTAGYAAHAGDFS